MKRGAYLLNETLGVVSDKTMNLRIKMKDGVYYRTLLIGSALLGNSSGSELASCQASTPDPKLGHTLNVSVLKCENIALKLIKDNCFVIVLVKKIISKYFFDCFVLSPPNKVHQELRFLLQGVGGGAKQLDCLVAAMRQDRLHVRPSSPTAVQSKNGKWDLGFSKEKKSGN